MKKLKFPIVTLKAVVLFSLLFLTTSVAFCGDKVTFIAPQGTSVVITNSTTTERIYLQQNKPIELSNDMHYFIDVTDLKTNVVEMLEKKQGSELITSLFF